MKITMKKILFILLLSFISVTHAQWILVSKNTDGNQYFVEINSIQQVGQYKRAWIKTEYSSSTEIALKHNIRSARSYEEHDCREKRFRELSLQLFKQPNLIDSDIHVNKVQEWSFVPPDTVVENVFKVVCKTK